MRTVCRRGGVGHNSGRRVDGLDYFDRADLVRAVEEGHEIGCHTFGHLRLPQAPADEIKADLERNAEFIAEALPGHRLSSFAYPFGDLDLGRKALLARRFPICRGIWPGINAGRMDFGQLKAVSLERLTADSLDVEAWLDRADAPIFAQFPRRSSLLHGVEAGCRIAVEITQARAWPSPGAAE